MNATIIALTIVAQVAEPDPIIPSHVQAGDRVAITNATVSWVVGEPDADDAPAPRLVLGLPAHMDAQPFVGVAPILGGVIEWELPPGSYTVHAMYTVWTPDFSPDEITAWPIVVVEQSRLEAIRKAWAELNAASDRLRQLEPTADEWRDVLGL